MDVSQLRAWALLFAVSAVAGCVTSTTLESSNEVRMLASGARVLIVEPDVELSLITTTGLREIRADWTQTGKDNVTAQIHKRLARKNHQSIAYVIDPARERDLQIIRLHEVVGGTILTHRYANIPLPSKPRNVFDWSLGPGVRDFAQGKDADYALFVFARGAYASSGRVALVVLGAIGGVGVGSIGDQQAFASLVDLESGDIVWFNVTQTGSGLDMRKPEGAEQLVDNLLRGVAF